MTNREGTKRCPVLCGSEIWVILCVMVFMNNMQCVKIMLMHANWCINVDCMDVNYM